MLSRVFILLKTQLRNYGAESLIFDLIGLILILLFQKFIASGKFLASVFSPVLAALLVHLSFTLIALKLQSLFLKARNDRSGFSSLVLSGAYALMTIAQPVVLTAMLRNFSILPNEPFTLIAFFIGIAIIFPAVLGYDNEKPSALLKYLGIALAAGVFFFGSLPLAPSSQSYFILAISLFIYLICFLFYSPTLNFRPFTKLPSFYQNLKASKVFRFLNSLITTFLLWTWWELAIDSIGISSTQLSLGGKLMILYFTGPLLYRISLMILPPFSWIKLIMGLIVFLLPLYY